MSEQELQSEILSADDAKLREMCGSLKRVSAPNNFNMRVKARIAAHNPQAQRKPFFTFLKVAAPLGLAAVFLGAVVSTNFYTADEKLVSQIAASYESAPKSAVSLSSDNEINAPLIASNNGFNANFESNSPRTVNVNINEALATTRPSDLGKIYQKNNLINNNSGGGSRTSAFSQTPIIRPRENSDSNPNAAKTNSENISSAIEKGFDSVGIKAVSSGNGWHVQSVSKNSPAERSEIKPNDLIETVDGVRFSEMKDFKINIGTKLTLVRENERMVITLK